MSDRQVTRTDKDAQGDITRLCGPWGNSSKLTAISEIETGQHTYFVQQQGTNRSNVHVVNAPTGKYLRTDPDGSPSNNLDNLPAC